MGTTDNGHLMSARDQRPRELIRARATRSPRGREMLMEIEEAQLIEGTEDRVDQLIGWPVGRRERQ